jgi:hypothetical protein
MEKIKSTKVKVFPTAFRGPSTGTTKYNPESRLTTEFNVTNLINRLSSKDSFVISWANSIVIFNIHGYYFEINLDEFLSGVGSTWTNIYASIKLLPFLTSENGNTKYKAFTLVGREDGGSTVPPSGRILDTDSSGTFIFEGLGLHETPITPTSGEYQLHLLTGGPSSWSIPTTSKLKFKAEDVEGLPTINNSTTLNTTSTIFANTTAGTAGQLSVSQGGTSAPTWISTASVTVGKATQLETGRTIWGQSFNGTANISGAITGTGSITPTTTNTSNIGASNNVYANVYATTFVGALSGNSTTATTLQTARNIGGVSFNGSANINLPGVNIEGNQNTTGSAAKLTTSRLLQIGATGKFFNGESDVSWSLGDIGAAASSHTHTKSQITDFAHTHPISEVTNLQTELDSKQATITGAATSIVSSNLTASRALTSNSSGKVAVSAVTSTELGHVSGVTSAIQTQLNNKANHLSSYVQIHTNGSSSYIPVTSLNLLANKRYKITFNSHWYRTTMGGVFSLNATITFSSVGGTAPTIRGWWEYSPLDSSTAPTISNTLYTASISENQAGNTVTTTSSSTSVTRAMFKFEAIVTTGSANRTLTLLSSGGSAPQFTGFYDAVLFAEEV